MRSLHLLLIVLASAAIAGGAFLGAHFGVLNIPPAEAQKPVGTWTATSSMQIAAVSHDATLLAGGDVLVTGGEDAAYSRPTAFAQRYHVSNGTWSLLAPMHSERIGHTATLLKNGNVLVVGGLGSKLEPLKTAELYKPSRNVWVSTPPLPAVRFSHSATLLPDGRVLVVGGIVAGKISRTTLLFDPRTSRWSAGPPTLSPHAQQSAVTLPHGRVLIAGGYGGRAEVYDHSSNRWTEVGGPGGRAHPVVSLLSNGDVLFATGVDTSGHPFASASLFNPKTDRWSSAATMQTGRDTPIGVELRDGRVLVAGGGADHTVLTSAEIYNPRTNAWVTAAPMSQARSAATAVLLRTGKVLVCGGTQFGSVIGSCELYHA